MSFDLENEWADDFQIFERGTRSGLIEIETAKKWHAAYRKAQNSNLLRKQEIKRLRADNAGLSKAVIDIREERDLAQAEFRAYHKAWEEQATRVQELEDALVNERAWRICHIPQDRVGHWPRYEPMLQDEARQQLQAEGKIGPDVMPRSWQITEEQLEDALVEERARVITSHPLTHVIDEDRTEASMRLQAEGKIGPDVMPRSWQITEEQLEDALVEKQTQLMPTAPSCYAEARRQAAINQLRAEGKIGPDANPHDHTAEMAKPNADHQYPPEPPRSWRITDERKAALKRLYGLLVIRYKYSYPDETETLRGMLEEAVQE